MQKLVQRGKISCLFFIQTPFGQIDLQGARLEEIDTPTESDDDGDIAMPPKHVIAIWPPYQGPTYLTVPTKQEKVK